MRTPTLVVPCVLKAFKQSAIFSFFNPIHSPAVFKSPKVLARSTVSSRYKCMYFIYNALKKTFYELVYFVFGLVLIYCSADILVIVELSWHI